MGGRRPTNRLVSHRLSSLDGWREREREKGKGNIKVPTHDQVTPERDACGGGQYLVDILMNKYIREARDRKGLLSIGYFVGRHPERASQPLLHGQAHIA